jgi:hypothetical protein
MFYKPTNITFEETTLYLRRIFFGEVVFFWGMECPTLKTNYYYSQYNIIVSPAKWSTVIVDFPYIYMTNWPKSKDCPKICGSVLLGLYFGGRPIPAFEKRKATSDRVTGGRSRHTEGEVMRIWFETIRSDLQPDKHNQIIMENVRHESIVSHVFWKPGKRCYTLFKD